MYILEFLTLGVRVYVLIYLPSIVPRTGLRISWVQFLSQIDVSQLGYRFWPELSRSTNNDRFSSSPSKMSLIFVGPATGAVSFFHAIRFKPWFNQNRHFLYRFMVDLTFDINIVLSSDFFFDKYRTVFIIL